MAWWSAGSDQSSERFWMSFEAGSVRTRQWSVPKTRRCEKYTKKRLNRCPVKEVTHNNGDGNKKCKKEIK